MTPIAFTDEEMSLLINLSVPIDPAARPAFLDAVAAAVEAKGQPSGGGLVHQVGRQIQRQFWGPAADLAEHCRAHAPRSRRLRAWAGAERANFKAGKLRARPRLSLVERPGLFSQPASVGVLSANESIDGGGRGAAHNRPGHLNCSRALTRARSRPSPGRILVRKRQRPGSEHYGDDAIIGRRASWPFRIGQRWGHDLAPTKARWRGRGAVGASRVPVTSCSKRPYPSQGSWPSPCETTPTPSRTFASLPGRSSANPAAGSAATTSPGLWRSTATPSSPSCGVCSPIARRRDPTASTIGARSGTARTAGSADRLKPP
jgi:hypothetical protein